jgi:hypothetical protein
MCWSILSHQKDLRAGEFGGESKRFRKCTSSRVENQLKTIKLRARKVEKDRVAIAVLGMNERCSNSSSNSRTESLSIHDLRRIRKKLRFRYRGNERVTYSQEQQISNEVQFFRQLLVLSV